MADMEFISKYLKEEVKKVGGVRPLSRLMNLNPTTIDNYIEKTVKDPRRKTLQTISTYSGIPIGRLMLDTGADVIDITPGLAQNKEGKEDTENDMELSVRILNDRMNDQAAAIVALSKALDRLHDQYNGLKHDCDQVLSCLKEYRETGNRDALERLGVEG